MVKSLFTRMPDRLAEFCRKDPRRFCFIVGALLVLTCIGYFLIKADAPWEGDAAERLAANEKLRIADYVQIWSWYAALTNLIIWAVLLLTNRWWWRWSVLEGKPELSQTERPKPGRRITLLSVLGLLVAIVLAISLRVPNSNHYLLLDEQDNMRRSIFGYSEVHKGTGEPRFYKASWTYAFFENRLANNPVLFSVAAKACNTIWQSASGEGELRFHRRAIRIPSLVCGILSIAVFWLFMFMIGMPISGALAALFLAVHPYHIDYSIQARGYGMMFLFVGTALCSAVMVYRRGTWKWFACLGLSLALALGSYTGATYFVMAFGSALAVYFGWRGFVKREPFFRALLVRLMVVGAISGGLYWQLIAPSFPQIKEWLTGEFARDELGVNWLINAFTEYSSGVWFGQNWFAIDEAERPEYVPYVFECLSGDWTLCILLALVTGLAVFGFFRLWCRGGIVRPLLLGGIAAPVIAFCVHEYITHLWLHGWYILYFLPFFAFMFGSGLAGLASCFLRIKNIGPLASALVVAGFFLFYYLETKPNEKGDTGRLGRRPLAETPEHPITGDHVVFFRGQSQWVVYKEGRMIRIPLSAEAPKKYPFEEANLKVVIKN